MHDTACKALPIAAVFHKEVDRAVLSLGHAVAVCIDIVAEPVGIWPRKTDADTPFCAHAAVCNDIANDEGAVVSGTAGKSVCSLGDIEIDCTVVV